MTYVYFGVYVSDWMQSNVMLHVKDLNEETLKSFQLQADAFYKHLEELKSNLFVTEPNTTKQEINVLKFLITFSINFKYIGLTVKWYYKYFTFTRNYH